MGPVSAMHSRSPLPKGFDSIESTIEAFRNGEFIVVLDSQDRENEGDLIIAAQDITTEKMAFMVRYTSGLICAPITSELAHELALPQMVVDNEDPNRTAYTISIDSNDASFRRPGHVFPLKARDGGVLERTGHTEAAVEFCRLAGKAPAGVICEMVDDGEPIQGQAAMREPGMMRRDACLEFGRKWGLKVCTIEELVEYVQHEKGLANGVNGHH